MSTMETATLDELKRKRAEAQERWKEFEEARNEAVKKATAAGEGTQLPDDTVDALEALNAKYRESDGEVRKIQGRFEKMASWEDTGPSKALPGAAMITDPGEGRKLVSLGQDFVSSDAYKSWQEARPRRFQIEGKGPVPIDETTAAGDLVQPDVRTEILPLLYQRLTIADLVAPGTTTSNLVRYLTEDTYNNQADVVQEGGTKNQSELAFGHADEVVTKIAHFMKVTTEMLEDYAQIRSIIDARLRLGVLIKEEDQLLNGTDASGPELNGIFNRTHSIYTESSESNGDAIHKGITTVRNLFVEPDAMVVSPGDWEILNLEKDQNDQYYGGGPYTGAYGTAGNGVAAPRYWGLPVVVTAAMTDGTALVGAFRTQAQIFRRSGLAVTATNSNEDDFINNLVTVLCEERLAFAVYRPLAFCEVNGITA